VVSRIRADGGEAWFVKTDVSSAAETDTILQGDRRAIHPLEPPGHDRGCRRRDARKMIIRLWERRRA